MIGRAGPGAEGLRTWRGEQGSGRPFTPLSADPFLCRMCSFREAQALFSVFCVSSLGVLVDHQTLQILNGNQKLSTSRLTSAPCCHTALSQTRAPQELLCHGHT